jgi:hypothetical protein
MPHAQRVIGGLRLALDGDVATTRVPVICHATIENDGVRSFVSMGLFYEDRLERTRDGWRIVSRREALSWRDGEPRSR